MRAVVVLSELTVVDEHGHALGCPAYNQPTFTLCTCGAAERAGLNVKFSAEKTGDAANGDDLTFGEIEEQEAWAEHAAERIEQMAKERTAATGAN